MAFPFIKIKKDKIIKKSHKKIASLFSLLSGVDACDYALHNAAIFCFQGAERAPTPLHVLLLLLNCEKSQNCK
jgi:hypothetical protein